MKWVSFLFIFFHVCFSLSAVDSGKEMDGILRAVFSKELGLTLIGVKPMSLEECMGGFPVTKQERAVLISFLEGAFRDSGTFIFHVYSPIHGITDISLIHKPCFKRTMEQEAYLKSFVEKHYGTVERLFETIEKSDRSLTSYFKDDDIAIGLAFGYGLENSKYAARMIEIEPFIHKRFGFSCSQLRFRPSPFIVCCSYRFPLIYISQIPPFPTPAKEFVTLEEEWEWLNSHNCELPMAHPPYLFSIPFFIASQGDHTEKLIRTYLKGVNRLSSLFIKNDPLYDSSRKLR